MSQKIAVAIIHGVGREGEHFADPMMKQLAKRFAEQLRQEVPGPPGGLEMQPVYWERVLADKERDLWRKVSQRPLGAKNLRRFLIDFAGDAIAYQQGPKDRSTYDQIHAVFARTLRTLACSAGSEAPLCVIGHSLGTVIASNYLYDLQEPPDKQEKLIGEAVRKEIGNTPLERGETLALLYTLGSPLALWNLRYPDFGSPIRVPSPKFAKHYPGVKGEWVNFYDKDDVLAYPLRPLGDAVQEDRSVNVGGFLFSWSVLSHMHYWTASDVIRPIAKGLADLWKAVNPRQRGAASG